MWAHPSGGQQTPQAAAPCPAHHRRVAGQPGTAHLQQRVPRLPQLLIQRIQLVDACRHILGYQLPRLSLETECLAPRRAKVLVHLAPLTPPLARLRARREQMVRRNGRDGKQASKPRIPGMVIGTHPHTSRAHPPSLSGNGRNVPHIGAAHIRVPQRLAGQQVVLIGDQLPSPPRGLICAQRAAGQAPSQTSGVGTRPCHMHITAGR